MIYLENFVPWGKLEQNFLNFHENLKNFREYIEKVSNSTSGNYEKKSEGK